MNVTDLRIGLVGYGRGGRFFHAPLIAAAPGCTLAGVVTRSAERRAELEGDAPGTPAFGSLAELAGSGAVDAVVVTTPLDSHVDVVLEAVGLGLPVVCDKPFAPDAATAREVVAAAERAGVPLSVYQNRRWDADFLTLRRVLGTGGLGQVTRLESRMEQYPSPEGFSPTGGGVLRDFGSHLVDQALVLFGPVRSVYAHWHLVPDGSGYDDAFFAVLTHVSGVTTHLEGSWVLQGAPGPRFRVLGDEATYAAPGDDGQSGPLLSGLAPGTTAEPWGTVPAASWGAVHRGGTATPVPSERGDWTQYYSALAAALRGDGPLPVDPADSVAGLEVLDAARLSAERGEVVHLGDAAPRGT